MTPSEKLQAAILIISDTGSKDASTDRAIPVLETVFAEAGNNQWDLAQTKIVPDDVLEIQRSIISWSDESDGNVNLIVTSGGTGFAVKDKTPEVS
jgi:gephyrin